MQGVIVGFLLGAALGYFIWAGGKDAAFAEGYEIGNFDGWAQTCDEIKARYPQIEARLSTARIC